MNATNQHKTMKHINTTQQEMPRMEPVKRPKTPGQEAYMPNPQIKEEMDVEQFNQGFERDKAIKKIPRSEFNALPALLGAGFLGCAGPRSPTSLGASFL